MKNKQGFERIGDWETTRICADLSQHELPLIQSSRKHPPSILVLLLNFSVWEGNLANSSATKASWAELDSLHVIGPRYINQQSHGMGASSEFVRIRARHPSDPHTTTTLHKFNSLFVRGGLCPQASFLNPGEGGRQAPRHPKVLPWGGTFV